MARMAVLASDRVETIIYGREPPGLSLAQLLNAGGTGWEQQR